MNGRKVVSVLLNCILLICAILEFDACNTLIQSWDRGKIKLKSKIKYSISTILDDSTIKC